MKTHTFEANGIIQNCSPLYWHGTCPLEGKTEVFTKKKDGESSSHQCPSIMKAKEETEAKEMKPLLNSKWMKVLLAD
jgi:hypothetical protein